MKDEKEGGTEGVIEGELKGGDTEEVGKKEEEEEEGEEQKGKGDWPSALRFLRDTVFILAGAIVRAGVEVVVAEGEWIMDVRVLSM